MDGQAADDRGLPSGDHAVEVAAQRPARTGRWAMVVAGLVAGGLAGGAWGSPGGAAPRVRALDLLDGLDPATTAYVVTSGAGGNLPGCGAISAIDLATGAVRVLSPKLGSRSDLSAAADLSAFASGGGGGPKTLQLMDARDNDTTVWASRRLDSRSGRLQLVGSATAILDGALWFGVGGTGVGLGVGRIPLPWLSSRADRQDVNPLDAFFSTRNELPVEILPDPNGRTVYVLSQTAFTAATAAEVVREHRLRLHILDRRSLTAHVAAIELPSVVVDEPPGAGLREVGVHSWLQNGRIAYATLLGPSRDARGPQPLWAVVNRWRARELTFANLRAMVGDAARTVTATLPADYAFAGALAASHGPNNLGLVAVHGGDKVGVFAVAPVAGTATELARLAITPVVSPLIDDRRMMSGPIAWSADGSQLIVAGNEGAADALIVAVDGCGGTLRLRHAVTVCPYDVYNDLAGIVTADRAAPATAVPSAACPAPGWIRDPWSFSSRYLLALPWVSASDGAGPSPSNGVTSPYVRFARR